MRFNTNSQFHELIAPPHPTYKTKDSRNRILDFLSREQIRSPGVFRPNFGSAARRLTLEVINLDLYDFYRWTPEGIRKLKRDFDIKKIRFVAGPASALAWQLQETMTMLFSFNCEVVYKIGLRIFGWLAKPISGLDILLEKNPMAWRAASGYAAVAVKAPRIDAR